MGWIRYSLLAHGVALHYMLPVCVALSICGTLGVLVVVCNTVDAKRRITLPYEDT